MTRASRTVLIIPALNEEETIGPLVERVPRSLVEEVVVVDNGSTDSTAEKARSAGAHVLCERRRGYGSACLKAIREVDEADVYVFLDGDGSDDPQEIGTLLDAIEEKGVDLVIGSRVLGDAEKGALTPIQRFGNALTCGLVQFLWGVVYTDLGPFRAIRASALKRLEMSDPDFGWTIEMQVKAVQRGLKVLEVPVSCRVRAAGKSKVSGTVTGSARAGARILGYVFEAKVQELLHRRSGQRNDLADRSPKL